MRVTFHVERAGVPGRWRIRRGQSRLAMFDDQGRAIAAAESFARLAAQSGEDASVSLDAGRAPEILHSFAADPLGPIIPPV